MTSGKPVLKHVTMSHLCGIWCYHDDAYLPCRNLPATQKKLLPPSSEQMICSCAVHRPRKDRSKLMIFIFISPRIARCGATRLQWRTTEKMALFCQKRQNIFLLSTGPYSPQYNDAEVSSFGVKAAAAWCWQLISFWRREYEICIRGVLPPYSTVVMA